MEGTFSTDGGGGGLGGGLGMIQAHYIYWALYSITSAPPQIIRHKILEVGDPGLHGLKTRTSEYQPLRPQSSLQNHNQSFLYQILHL